MIDVSQRFQMKIKEKFKSFFMSEWNEGFGLHIQPQARNSDSIIVGVSYV